MRKMICSVLALVAIVFSLEGASQAAETRVSTGSSSRTSIRNQLSAQAYADSVKLGAAVGPTFSSYSLTPADPRQVSMMGMSIAAQLDIPVSGVFHMQPELRFVRRGVKLVEKNPLAGNQPQPQQQPGQQADAKQVDASATISLTYMQIPVLAQFKFVASSVVLPYVSLGPVLKFRLGGGISGNDTLGKDVTYEATAFDALKMKSFAFGAELNAGSEFKIASATAIFAQFRYELGLSNETDREGASVKDRTFGLTTGVNFAL